MATTKTIVVVGAGPGLGLAIAKRFGQAGFRVGLVARRKEALAGYVQSLKQMGIEAGGFPADITQEAQIADSFGRIRKEWGPVDVLEYSPLDRGNFPRLPVNEVSTEQVLMQLKINVLGAVACVQQVLPDMLRRGEGAIFLTAGTSAVSTIPTISHVGISNAGERSYALSLNNELGPKGIFAAFVCIKTGIKEGTAGDPGKIADAYMDLYEKRDRAEIAFPGD